MGPYAGLDLLRKILEQTIAHRDQDHLTIVSLSQPNQIVDRTEYLLGQVRENPGQALATQVQALARMGAEIAGIPCNTAHVPKIFDVIQTELKEAACPVKLLHMIEEVALFLKTRHPDVKRIGILSTTGTYRARLYPDFLSSAGFVPLLVPMELQDGKIHPAISDQKFGVKARGGGAGKARENLLEGVWALRKQGAQAVILGCTEIPLAIPEPKIDDTIMIDPALILARALIREAAPSKLKPLD